MQFMPIGVVDRTGRRGRRCWLHQRLSDARRASGGSCGPHRDRVSERCSGSGGWIGEREGTVAGVPRAEGRRVISLAPGTKVFLACRPVDLRNGFDGLAAKAQQIIGADPFSGHLFLFRGKRGDYLKALVPGTAVVCVSMPSGWRGPLRVAADRRWVDDADAGAVGAADRSRMLMPLLVRLTDPQIEMADGVVSQVPNAVNNGSRILEQVRAAGLSIDEEALLPDLDVKPLHRDVELGGQLRDAEEAGIVVPAGRCLAVLSPAPRRIRCT